MRHPSAALAAAVLVLAGCSGIGGEDKTSVEAGDLQKLVLRPDDFTGSWLRFDVGRQGLADAPSTRADLRRFGRIDGWKARFKRAGTGTTRGPLVVESRVDLFEAEDGARKEFGALERDLDAGRLLGSGSRIRVPVLGEESVAATLRQVASPNAIRFYLVAWRQDALTAAVLVNGFDGKTTLSDVLALARKQQSRIAAATSG